MAECRAPLPPDEAARLDELCRYQILDTEPDADFDDLTRAAAAACETPIALVSFVDAQRQWFKSRVGLAAQETPRGLAFCAHAILQDQPLVVRDALDDPRFANNPLVREEPRIRFYAGMPLITEKGFRLGTLCVIDRRPRNLTETQLQTLRSLARAVVVVLDLRQAVKTLSGQADTLREAKVAQEKARIAAEEANRAKSEFLASMSHELRTPLTSILGLSEALQQGVFGALNERQGRSLKYIEDSGRHLLNLINDILDLSKIEAGRLEISEQLVAVAELCRSCIEITAQSAEAKKLRVTWRVEPPDLTLVSDPRRLLQILFNLLSNAVKFTPEAGNVELIVRANPREETVSFLVTDTGIGIAAEDLSRLFQPFVQLDTRQTPGGQGTGLGLAVVKRLTDRLGGSVHVESQEGQGSRFMVVLPWHRDRAGAPPPQECAAPRAMSDAPTTTKESEPAPLILIGEDDEVFLHLFSEFFRARGYRIEMARSGRETIDRCRLLKPDVILVDIRMPYMDGFEAIRTLRRDPDRALASRPIIALTALVMPGDRERCIAAGATAYVSKPVRLAELLELVKTSLSRASGWSDSPQPTDALGAPVGTESPHSDG